MNLERQPVTERSSPTASPGGWRARVWAWAPFQLAASRTGRHAGMVVAGNAVNRALTFLVQSVLARAMEKPVFAVFSLAAMTLEVATELADLGLNVNLVRNYSRHAETNRPAALSVVQLVLRIKVLWVLFLSTTLYLLVPCFAGLIGDREELTWPFRFAAVGLAGPVMVYFALAHLQAVRWFGRYILVNVLERIGLLALVGFLAATANLTLRSALGVWILLPFLAAALGLILAPHDYLRARRIEPGVAREVFHFGKWALVLSLLNLARWRLDVFMVAGLSSEERLVDYIYAVRLVALFQVVTQGLNTAFLPRVGRFASVAECRTYLRMLGRLSPLVALGSGLVCAFAWVLMVLSFGPKAAGAVPIFRILLISETLMVLGVPMSLLFFRLDRVDLICLISAIMLIVSAGANLILVPRFGGMGAAVAYLLVCGFSLGSTLILVLYALSRQPQLSRQGQSET